MDVNAGKGQKIVFSNPTSGRSLDQYRAEKYLRVGSTYTVEEITASAFETRVFLQEIEVPCIAFNVELFEDER